MVGGVGGGGGGGGEEQHFSLREITDVVSAEKTFCSLSTAD